ncbi:PH domain-containing protein [Micromonospora echinofusca]|uniref:Low molecular weight protein antigen 6 PH domain-containing protein n=1 Tax=Micromonospora echinofusca TaxID=47858 RepID=A0ABS3VUF4_MICEH|nr:PH domain-containing protein [Micromonospora echinofusca]MBO4208161.1 hypothetical protein [Micromonospora echinofusca]
MRRWERPYMLDIATGFAVLTLFLVAGAATFLVFMYAFGVIPAPAAIIFAVWLAAAVVVTVRRAMLGVYVSDDGLRSRSLLRTTTLPWAAVSDIRSGAATVAGLDIGRSAIVIERIDGVLIQTPLQRGDLFRPFTFRPELGRLATWPEHYDEILAILQAHHRDAQDRRQAAPTSPSVRPSTAGGRPAKPSAGASRTRTARRSSSDDKRRDLHALARQHQRGALTDAEFAVESAKINGVD